MNTRTLKTWASVVLCGSMLAGCASLEERLASNDPATKREAEAELISQSRRSPKLEDRIAAIKRVTDESVLLSAAISARGPYVPDGEYVLTKLKGENNFITVVNSAQDPRIRKVAFAKIDNQAVFEKLAVGASDSGIRAEAFKKLTSQDSILKVASQTSDTAIKIAAIDKVADKSKLLPIVFKKSTAPAMSKGDIQRAMMAIMRDRRTSDTEKKQKMAALNAMSNGGPASFDNAVVDAFIIKCTDKPALLKMIADYGPMLTADQCAKVVAQNSDDEVKSAIAEIADKKICDEVLQYKKEHLDTLKKYFEKVQAMSNGDQKAKLVFELCHHEFDRDTTTKQCDALLESLNAEGVVIVLNLISKQNEPEEGANKHRARIAINRFSTRAKIAALAHADKIDKYSFGRILSSVSDTKEGREMFRKNLEWDSVDAYEAVGDSETAEYLLTHAKFNKLKEYTYWQFNATQTMTVKKQLAKIVWHLVNKLDKDARARLMKESVVHLNAAKKDHVVFERFYIGMPMLDYLLITVAEGLTWWGDRDYCMGRISDYSVLKDGDWRSAWTVSHFVFNQKERYRIFKTEGDLKGILAFVKKYCKKDADVRDIKYDTDLWWMFTDDAHELKVSVHSKNGALNIYSF